MGESRLKIMFVSDPVTIAKTWGHYIEGMEEVLKYSHGESSLAHIYQRLVRGEMQLWVCFQDREYVGFFTTRFDDMPQGARYMTVFHVYGKPGIPRTLFFEGMAEVERMAKKYDCQFIRFWTLRDKGFARKLESHGWHPKYMEMVKEVN